MCIDIYVLLVCCAEHMPRTWFPCGPNLSQALFGVAWGAQELDASAHFHQILWNATPQKVKPKFDTCCSILSCILRLKVVRSPHVPWQKGAPPGLCGAVWPWALVLQPSLLLGPFVWSKFATQKVRRMFKKYGERPWKHLDQTLLELVELVNEIQNATGHCWTSHPQKVHTEGARSGQSKPLRGWCNWFWGDCSKHRGKGGRGEGVAGVLFVLIQRFSSWDYLQLTCFESRTTFVLQQPRGPLASTFATFLRKFPVFKFHAESVIRPLNGEYDSCRFIQCQRLDTKRNWHYLGSEWRTSAIVQLHSAFKKWDGLRLGRFVWRNVLFDLQSLGWSD